MKEQEFTAKVTHCLTDELSASEKQLIEKAKNACLQAYAPYSHFAVGAALLLENGTILTGSNQENIAFPSGLCAERNVLFSAQHLYPDSAVRVLAIAARDLNEPAHFTSQPVSPCGACRQVMAENIQRHQQSFRLLLYGEEDIIVVQDARDLLPLSFSF